MTPYFSASQNRMRLMAVFGFTVLLALAFFFLRPAAPSGKAMAAGAEEARMFMGIQRVSAGQLHKLLPEIKGKPALLEFHSRLCHDCRRMAPVLAQLMPQYPQVVFRKYDILEDKAKHSALLRAFKPVTVPVLVFVDKNGRIKNVLYNYQKADAIQTGLRQILPSPK